LYVDESLDQALAAIAERQHGVFASHHLRGLGFNQAERQWRLRSGRWIAMHVGVYRIGGAPLSWQGALLAACWAGGTRAVASHRSAAALYGVPGKLFDVAEITCPRWRRARHDGVVVHESLALSEHDMTVVDGIPVTTVERTIFDLCGVCRPFTVELAVDDVLRRDLVAVDDLVALLRRLGTRGRKGTAIFRELLESRDSGYAPTESEQELMLVRVLRDHGLPEPERQYSIYDSFGNFVARPDLVYRDRKIAMEYDSYQYHVGKGALVRDSRRRNRMALAGWLVLAATAEDVRYGNGAQFARQVRDARAARQPASIQAV
jgi:hypothetical protein